MNSGVLTVSVYYGTSIPVKLKIQMHKTITKFTEALTELATDISVTETQKMSITCAWDPSGFLLDEDRSALLVFFHSIDADVVLNPWHQVTECHGGGSVRQVELCAAAFHRGYVDNPVA